MKSILYAAMASAIMPFFNGSNASHQLRGLPDSVFARQVEAFRTGGKPLPLDERNSADSLAMQSEAVAEHQLSLDGWRHEGLGQLFRADGELRMLVPIETGKRAAGPPDDPDYATYGRCTITKTLPESNLNRFNRIVMDVRPVCKGTGITNLNIIVGNNPPSGMGAHLVNLRNNRWNRVAFDFSGLPRNNVQSIGIYTDVKGRNGLEGDSVVYEIRNIRLVRTATHAKETGWDVAPGTLAYSMPGYLPWSEKTAIAGLEADSFEVIDARSGAVWHKGRLETVATTTGRHRVADFSGLTRQGVYRLKAGNVVSSPFPIGKDAFVPSMWRVLNFIFCQRCGSPVEGIHGACHADLMSLHKGRTVSYAGGWHDAGDLSQQTLQSGDVAFALAECYNALKAKHPALANRMKDEAEHGLRFILRQRLGGGFHASSMGLLHWTDGIVGTGDNITTVRTQDNSFDNFLYAGYEAYCARVFGGGKSLSDSLRKAAVEDFAFADKKFSRHGFDTFQHPMEHTYNTSRSLYKAVMSWSASQLFRLTGDRRYAQMAAGHIRYVLRCQAKGNSRDELNGFFYRDESRRSIVHFIHQSRSQMFAMALDELVRTQPGNPDKAEWMEAASLLGRYLKSLKPYTAPYGMLAAGTHASGEWQDKDGFDRLHLWAPANAAEMYERQLRRGIKIDSLHYVRRFPTWFTIFNGNESLLLSDGKAAAILGRLLGDGELMGIATEQLYWTVGKNPFGQSLIFGEGRNYPSMDSFSSGEITGEMPVGIRSKGDEDVPYWPQTNNACYKEVWTTSAGKWLSLLSELHND